MQIWTPISTRESRNVVQKPKDHSFWSKWLVKAKVYRFLQEVGYEDVFNPDEINEIKDLYEKAQADLVEPVVESSVS